MYSDKKKRLEIHWSMLNAHCACRKATLYLLPAIATKVESLVMDIVTNVLIRSLLSLNVQKARTTLIELLV